MNTCERCGKEIPDNVAICPNCGTVSSTVQEKFQPPTKHGPYSGRYMDTPPEQAYPPRQDYPDYQPPLTEYRSQQQYHSYGQPFNAPPVYQQPIDIPWYLWCRLVDGGRNSRRHHTDRL